MNQEVIDKISRLRNLVFGVIENYVDSNQIGILSWFHGQTGYTRAVNCLLLISCPLATENALASIIVIWGILNSDVSGLLLSQLVQLINQEPLFSSDLTPIRTQYSLYETNLQEIKIARHLIHYYLNSLVEMDPLQRDLPLRLLNHEVQAMIDLINLINTGTYDRNIYNYRTMILQRIINR